MRKKDYNTVFFFIYLGLFIYLFIYATFQNTVCPGMFRSMLFVSYQLNNFFLEIVGLKTNLLNCC